MAGRCGGLLELHVGLVLFAIAQWRSLVWERRQLVLILCSMLRLNGELEKRKDIAYLGCSSREALEKKFKNKVAPGAK